MRCERRPDQDCKDLNFCPVFGCRFPQAPAEPEERPCGLRRLFRRQVLPPVSPAPPPAPPVLRRVSEEDLLAEIAAALDGPLPPAPEVPPVPKPAAAPPPPAAQKGRRIEVHTVPMGGFALAEGGALMAVALDPDSAGRALAALLR